MLEKVVQVVPEFLHLSWQPGVPRFQPMHGRIEAQEYLLILGCNWSCCVCSGGRLSLGKEELELEYDDGIKWKDGQHPKWKKERKD